MNKMRRLPGPACCRLSEGDQTPEALYELFRDWQRTHTQSSVKALRGPRLQMDVWFCRAQEPMPRGTLLRVEHPELLICTLSRACPGHPCLHLTNDYMDDYMEVAKHRKNLLFHRFTLPENGKHS